MNWEEFDELICDDGGRKRSFEGDDWTENKRRAVHQKVDIGLENEDANGAYTTIEPFQVFPSDPEVEPAANVESQPTYDTCFGVVMVQTTLDKAAPKLGDAALDVRVSENVVKLYGDDDKLVGLFISDGLTSLSRQFSVHMTATLVAETSQDGNPAQKGKRSNTQTRNQPIDERPARIVIYGLSIDKDLIGRHLSAAELHLQHPTPEEYDPSVGYYNPHLLLHPGAKMPRIQDLSLQNEDETGHGRTGSAALDEVSQGKIWRIFDLASGQEVRPQVTSSPRLKSTLQEYVY
ncbi:hypothetical protein FSARC_506 [Fusarium sarcochroum]|uniref:Uncharacterized protein n=1 Tax=Fusarium sarcochroum TaxID=1208366 RepID=A0A8H4UB66_9HYPO|nr:hypothetical protein FSARC_506 [Fusarium sarcochroum]